MDFFFLSEWLKKLYISYSFFKWRLGKNQRSPADLKSGIFPNCNCDMYFNLISGVGKMEFPMKHHISFLPSLSIGETLIPLMYVIRYLDYYCLQALISLLKQLFGLPADKTLYQ